MMGFETNDSDPQVPNRPKVIIIGAGLAGLAAAFEVKRLGLEPIILEGQARVGGRVYTNRQFAPGLYAEMGAMRIPRVHHLTLDYCKQFGLQLRPFVMDNPRTLVYIAGKRWTYGQVNDDPDRLGFDLEPHERGRSYDQLWDEAIREIRELYDQQGLGALATIATSYDRYSIRDFLRERGFSEGALELYGLMSFREANMNAGIVEQLREIVGRAFEDMQEIVGGMDQLPNAFYQHLAPHVRLGAHVDAVTQAAGSVTVHFRTPAGTDSVTGDYAVCTI